jgi:oligopeptide/dipeptide ABC transporter ATP-binding protein
MLFLPVSGVFIFLVRVGRHPLMTVEIGGPAMVASEERLHAGLGRSHVVNPIVSTDLAGGMAPVPAVADTVLELADLQTHFRTPAGTVRAVDGVSYTVRRGETLCVVGESGCGKSVTALSILRLIPSPPGRIVGGQIRFEGRDLLAVSETEMERIRGNDISMIFQEPMTSLNPLYTIGRQISEAIALHQGLSRGDAMVRAIEMLRRVAIPDAEGRAATYPHQLSGGMRQRVMIAMALSCNPKVLIADEPTTALDVTIQAQILALIHAEQKALGTAVVLITHDMGVVAETADRVVVMYAGRKVEEASVVDLFERPAHPYTRGLLGSIPDLECAARRGSRRPRLTEIKGMVPSLARLPAGCSFAPRCGFTTSACLEAVPPVVEHRPGHWAACWNAERMLEGAVP